jgi:hypothetical protein
MPVMAENPNLNNGFSRPPNYEFGETSHKEKHQTGMGLA